MEWVADRDEVLTEITVDGRVLRLVRPVEAKAGREYVLTDLGDRTATLKRPWVTPVVVEHSHRAIQTGLVDGEPEHSTTTAHNS